MLTTILNCPKLYFFPSLSNAPLSESVIYSAAAISLTFYGARNFSTLNWPFFLAFDACFSEIMRYREGKGK